MSTIEITELQAATTFAEGDLTLIRKNGENKDRKISQSNLIKSIGNPAVKGFMASSDEANKVTLNPSNGTIIDTYYDGMEISFISPFNSTGLVQVRIGSLPYKDILVLNSAASVELTNTTYIQAIYVAANDKFYQTNAATTQVFTNEYLAQGVVAGDNSLTTYTLNSAYGIPKTEYYNGMSISFTTDIASKGGVLVNIDGLGNKHLTDPAGDKIPNDLLANQVIFAIYDGTNFIKNLFSEEVPDAPELPADVFNEETGEIVFENVPEVNKLNLTVGNAGNDYTTITAAIKDLVDNFGEDGGNRLCTITLSNTYLWNEVVNLNGKNYSWITITTSGTINIAQNCYLYLSNSTINISGSYSDSNVDDMILNTTVPKTFCNIGGTSTVNFINFNLSTTNGLIKGNCNSYNLKNCTITNKDTTNKLDFIDVNYSGISTIKDTNITLIPRNNNTIDYSAFITNAGILTIDNLTVNSNSLNGNYFRVLNFIYNRNNITILNSNITVFGSGLTSNFSDTLVKTSNIRSLIPNVPAVTISYNARATLTDCNCSSVSNLGIDVASGSSVILENGDYRNGNVNNVANIVCNGEGTFIRKNTTVKGGISAINGGVITNS
jgi:hypothetical protein